MKIKRCDIFRYDIPLLRPLNLMGRVITNRSGLIILVYGEKDGIGIGEVAPFPGLHKEDLAEARDYLCRVIDKITGSTIPEDLQQLRRWWDQHEKSLPPSVTYGMEQALILLLASVRGIPLYQLLFKTYHPIVRINGLLTGNFDEIIRMAKQYIHEGYKTLKLKVGRRSLEEDIQIVKSVRSTAGSETGLRLDANRSWSLEEAVRFGKAVSPCQIEYIEEPTKTFEELSGFYQQTGIPVAMDESLSDWCETGSDWPLGIRAVILKPDLIGGIFKTMEIAARAKDSQILPVISCSFQSGFAHAVLAQLSAGIVNPEIAVGLDTYKWFQYDILQKPFHVKRGQVDVRDAARIMRDLRFDLLEKST
ncbi:MAG: o-succinylbenzoate synthase [bacterium]